jgi:hypothetical protein
VPKEPKKLAELFHDTLKDIYFAEKKILATLPKMAKAAHTKAQKAAFEKHHGETKGRIETARILEELMAGYEEALAESFERPTDRSYRPKSIQTLLAQSVRRRWPHLAEERLETVRPRIPLGQRFWPLTIKERNALDKAIIVRELMPQDLKIEINRLTRQEAMTMARYLGGVVGRAHGRQMDATVRQEWLSLLAKNRTSSLDAPSWLWSSVVELIALHEAAYLDHCHRYVLSGAA